MLPLYADENRFMMGTPILQKLPVGIQNFESLRDDGYLYVDKTAFMYQLVSTGRYYFLSRPRRFGKSLFLSMLHSYFDGRKDLFEGLAISSLEKEWKTYPVLHLDLNTQQYDTPKALEDVLNESVVNWERLYGNDVAEVGLGRRFQGVIRRACEKTGQRVVILVDEYDKPMLQAIGNEPLQTAYRNTLKAFYGALKSMDGYIKLGFLTGVTKFGKVSVFSDLNNLEDISMDSSYNEICGISEKELYHYFTPYIKALSLAEGETEEVTRAHLKRLYDGYHFTNNTHGVYNPFSLLNTFKKRTYGSYWFETGTPTYLVELLKQNDYVLEKMDGIETTEDVLNSVDVISSNPIPVIYQSGYLTIKGYDKVFKFYQLGFPNEEVAEGFFRFLLPFYSGSDNVDAAFQIKSFVTDVQSGNTNAFLHRLQSFFADTPYELVKNLENHYQNVLFIISKLMGFYVKAEYHTSRGRIDMVLQTADYTYVLEFKLDGSAAEALQQINSKGYALPFEADSHRQLIKIGLNFDHATRNIETWCLG